MVFEDRLQNWLQEKIKGSVLSAIPHPQSNTFLVLEKLQPTHGSIENPLKLHICLWYQYLTSDLKKEDDSIELNTSFMKGKSDSISLEQSDLVQAKLAFSKDGDLLFCLIDQKLFGRLFFTSSCSL
jgi:hypothetical protein